MSKILVCHSIDRIVVCYSNLTISFDCTGLNTGFDYTNYHRIVAGCYIANYFSLDSDNHLCHSLNLYDYLSHQVHPQDLLRSQTLTSINFPSNLSSYHSFDRTYSN